MMSKLDRLMMLQEEVKIAKKFGCKDLTLLYCVSNYPSDTSDFNLNIINILKDMNNIVDRNEKYLRACALHNWRRLLQMSIDQRLNSVEAQIWN